MRTLPLNDLFGAGKVITAVSDRSVNFALLPDGKLSPEQLVYLSQRAGRPVSGIVNIRQVHGDHVVVVRGPEGGRWFAPQPPVEADAIVTDVKGLPIAVRTADCLPVFLFDPVKHCAGIVHAGWKGTQQRITSKTVAVMQREFGSRPGDMMAAFGPAIRVCCYEVGEEFRGYFPQEVRDKGGKLCFDNAAANRRELLALGLRSENIFDRGECTGCSTEYFSYRREGKDTGRHLSMMVLCPDRQS